MNLHDSSLAAFFMLACCTPTLAALLASPVAPPPGAMTRYPPTQHWYNATLDHFSFPSGPGFAPSPDADAPGTTSTTVTTSTFPQRYFVYDKWRSGPDAPILLYFGNEGKLEDFYDNSGFVFESAPALGATVVFLEHRYYGESLPFGNASYATAAALRFLTIEHALADMSAFLADKRRLFGCGAARAACPVVLLGGSYGGMLAAWHRLKYPHLSVGAIAASAPVDLWPGEGKQAAFLEATLQVYDKFGGGGVGGGGSGGEGSGSVGGSGDEGDIDRGSSGGGSSSDGDNVSGGESDGDSVSVNGGGNPACRGTIETLLALVEELGGTAAGRSTLSQSFRTCTPLTTDGDRDRLVFFLKGALSTLAMVDVRSVTCWCYRVPRPLNTFPHTCAGS